MDPKHESELVLDQDLAVPKQYKVILLNDDFTPMEFVVMILQRHFQRSREEADRIMNEVHHKGAGVAGVYSREVAEMKVMQVVRTAKQNQYPLNATAEPEE